MLYNIRMAGNATYKFSFFAIIFVFAAAVGLYAPSVRPVLIWDDDSFIGGNSFIRDCSNLRTALNPANLFIILPVPMSARPVTNVTLIADACLGGGSAGMHRTNVLLHAVNAVLVFFLISTLAGSGLPALFGALVFALHPLAAEAVNIITFRSHLLGFLFFTAGLLAAVFYARQGRARQAAAAAACYLLAVLSVETAIVLPLTALTVVYFEKGRQGLKKLFPLIAVLAFLAIFYLWFRVPRSGYDITGISSSGIDGPSALYPKFLFSAVNAAGNASAGAVTEFILTPPWHQIYANYPARIYTMAQIALDYFKSMLLPMHLSTDYNPAVITSAAAGVLPLAAALAAVAAGALLYTRRRLEGLGLLMLLIALLPVLNIWPVYNIKTDRYLYLPMAGFALAAATLFARAQRAAGTWRPYWAGAAWLWLAALAYLSVSRIPEFKDNVSFFSAVVKQNPKTARARLNLAVAYQRTGNLAEYVGQTAEALKFEPENINIRMRLALGLARQGRRAEAGTEVLAILKKYPLDPGALNLARRLRLNFFDPAALGFNTKISDTPFNFEDTPPVKFPIQAIIDGACSECVPTMGETLLLRHPGAILEKVEAASVRGQALIAKHQVKTLPFYILSPKVELDPNFSYLKADYVKSDDRYSLKPGPGTYNPTVWLNRVARPRHLDLFVSPLAPGTEKIETALFSLLREPALSDLTVSMHFMVKGGLAQQLTSAQGTEGVNESLLQTCLFQHSSFGSYLAYLSCRNAAQGGKKQQNGCLERSYEITTCVEDGEGERLLRQDAELGQELGINSSGTILWENRYGPFAWDKVNFLRLTGADK